MAELGGSGEHDYTLHPAYRQVERELKPSWSDPYVYATDSTEVELSTYSYPLTDGEGRFVGICGIHILRQLIDSDAPHIYCLMRGKTLQGAESRLRTLLFYYFSDAFKPLFGQLIHIVLGDVTSDFAEGHAGR